jgi:hypothetical protein
VIWTTRALLAAPRVRYNGHLAVHYRIPLRTLSQERLQLVVDSSVINAEALAAMADTLADDPELRGLLGHQLVDGALSIFHKLAKMPDRGAAAGILCRLRRRGFLALLWRHAGNMAQRRRIARNWLRSWLAGIGR